MFGYTATPIFGGAMKHLKPYVLFVFVAATCCIAASANAQAGPVDEVANWLLGLLAVGVASGAAGYHVAQSKSRSAAATAEERLRNSPVLPAPASAPVDVYKVWYATNREMRAGEFTADLCDTLRYGDCQVAVPHSHKFGSTGSSAVVRALQCLTTGSDDALRIVKRSGWSLDEGTHGFLTSVAAAMTADANQILVYIHGYNVSFDDAIIRAAQIGFDLNVPGLTAAFCWPAKGNKAAYLADEDTIRLTVPKLAEFLTLLKMNFPDHKINILAHSMGNRALIEVLENLDRYPALAQSKFGQIIMAAPDIDTRYFLKVAAVYPRLSARTTLYICAGDQALDLSEGAHEDARLGYCPPVIVASGIDTIEATNVNLDWLGHSYYASAALVLYDMFTLLRDDRPPGSRPALLQAKTDEGQVYWQFRGADS
jgi:esterase/lipase superfamily enzyme